MKNGWEVKSLKDITKAEVSDVFNLSKNSLLFPPFSMSLYQLFAIACGKYKEMSKIKKKEKSTKNMRMLPLSIQHLKRKRCNIKKEVLNIAKESEDRKISSFDFTFQIGNRSDFESVKNKA